MHDVTSTIAKLLQLEQKRLPYGTRPFLLLRRVWLARLVFIQIQGTNLNIFPPLLAISVKLTCFSVYAI